MARPVVALVVGFTRRAGLLERSFAPLRRLKQAGAIDRIVYVTWDRADLDPWVAGASAMPEVELVRVPEPLVQGQSWQKKHFYQTHNIAAALALVPDEDTLILKLRPDVVMDEQFLAGKIRGFERDCVPSRLGGRFDVRMPRSPFRRKVWVPWADSNQPFFIEDGIFAALRCDAARLVTPASDDIVRRHGDAASAWIVHVARYIAPFLADYPIFQRYLRSFDHFVQNNKYRGEMLSEIGGDVFFWHLVIANAWILANNFHVDCGRQGQIVFYQPEDMAGPTDTPQDGAVSRPPYDDVEMWRGGQKPGEFLLNVRRIYGRLVDDSWQKALFTGPLSDMAPQTLAGILRCISLYRSGVLGEVEDGFYQTLERIHQGHESGGISPAPRAVTTADTACAG